MARHDGRVIASVAAGRGGAGRGDVERGSYWHADAIEVLEPSPDRVDSLCAIAGAYGSGCCDLAFVDPAAARRLKGEVVANSFGYLGGYEGGDLEDLEVSTVGTRYAPGGVPGCGSRSAPTAGPGSTAITATSW